MRAGCGRRALPPEISHFLVGRFSRSPRRIAGNRRNAPHARKLNRLAFAISLPPPHPRLHRTDPPASEGGESPTVNPASLDEPSIPYSEFLERLNSDQVAAVEFLAPNGDAAYATFKSSGGDGAVGAGGGRIRIGEGYPVEDPRGWSSPAFVVKAVARRGVPYKFVVPGLGDSFKEM
jgi:hypothetical protein